MGDEAAITTVVQQGADTNDGPLGGGQQATESNVSINAFDALTRGEFNTSEGGQENGDTASAPQKSQDAQQTSNTDTSQQSNSQSADDSAQTTVDDARLNQLLGKQPDGADKGKVDTTKEGQQQQQKPQDQTQQQARDYSGFTPVVAEALKKLHNNQFNVLAPILREHATLKPEVEKLRGELTVAQNKYKELESGKDSVGKSFYEHSDAYMLTPEFNDLSGRLQQAESVENHWGAQLEAIENGKEWRGLTTDAQGNIIMTAPMAASPNAKAQVIRNLSHVQMQRSNMTQQLQQMVSQHQVKHAQIVGNIKGVEDRFFPMYKDGQKKELLDKVGNDLASIGISRNNPAFSLLVKASSLAIEGMEMVKALSARGKTQQTVAANVASAGPSTVAGAGAANSAPTNGQVTLAMFDSMIGKS